MKKMLPWNYYELINTLFWKFANKMSFFWLKKRSDLVSPSEANINNSLPCFPFSRPRVSLEYIFFADDFSFSPYFARPILRLLSPLIVSLPLYSSYSTTFRLLPYLWTYFTLLSLVHSLCYGYLYFLCARTSNAPAVYWSLDRERCI